MLGDAPEGGVREGNAALIGAFPASLDRHRTNVEFVEVPRRKPSRPLPACRASVRDLSLSAEVRPPWLSDSQPPRRNSPLPPRLTPLRSSPLPAPSAPACATTRARRCSPA